MFTHNYIYILFVQNIEKKLEIKLKFYSHYLSKGIIRMYINIYYDLDI